MSLAANSLHTPAYEAHPASQIQWSDAPPLTQEMLSGTFWSLGDVNRGMFTRFMVLAPEGMIGNYFDPSFAF